MLKNIDSLHRRCLRAVFAIIVMTPFLLGFDITRHVTVRFDGQQTTLRTNSERPADIIREAGVVLEQGDGWRLLGVNDSVQDGSVIEVLRGKTFVVVRDGREEVYRSYQPTVGEAMKSLGIAYKKKRIYPDAKSALKDNMKIYVLNKNEELAFSEAAVQPGIDYQEDLDLAYGSEQVISEGSAGKARVISKVVKKLDGSKEQKELTRETLEKPVNKVVRKGIALSVKTPEGYKRYKKKMLVEASAYTLADGSGTGKTSIGLVPYEGIVAVDPRVIPYYTKMYIPGYGIAMAGDTGGAIVGNRIDLFMHDWHRAIQWGRRDIEIYILED